MRRKYAWLITLLLLAASGVVQRSAVADDEGSLLARRDYVELQLVHGRIKAVRPQYVGARTDTTENPTTGVRQRLSLSVANGIPFLQYEQIDPEQRLTLDIRSGSEVHICRTPLGGSTLSEVNFRQVPKQPLMMSIVVDGESREYQAKSWWHLMLAEPEACREHLLPILDYLWPSLRLQERTERVDRCLLRVAGARPLTAPKRVNELIAQLSSENFRQRQLADRELRALGPCVLCFLDELNVQQLDAEQRFRLRRIRRAVERQGGEGDTPLRVASWLVYDKTVWLNLLSAPELDRRQLAVTALSALCERTLEFDPEADVEERQRQIETLRASIFN